MEQLAQRFAFVKMLGKGEQGVVFEVIHEQQKMVVKVVEMGVEGINEIETQCTLNDLDAKTGIFTHAFGWQVCSAMPAAWADFVTFDHTERLLFIFMEKTMETWASVPLKPTEEKAILFLLLHGLMVARRDAGGFQHDDIHKENVMLQPIDFTRVVYLDGGYTVGPRLRFVPKLIDYGYAMIGYESDDDDSMFGNDSDEEGDGTPTTDLGSIQFLFQGRFEAFFNSPQFTTARQSTLKDHQAIQQLLDMPFFQEYQDKENKPTIRCSVCSASQSRPTQTYWQWRGRDPSLAFCSDACGSVWRRGIGAFI